MELGFFTSAALIFLAGWAPDPVEVDTVGQPVVVTIAENYQPVYKRLSGQIHQCQKSGFLRTDIVSNANIFPDAGSARITSEKHTTLGGDSMQIVDLLAIDDHHTKITVAFKGGSPERLSQSVQRWANGDTGC